MGAAVSARAWPRSAAWWSTAAFGGALAMIALYALLRTLAAPEPALVGWALVAAALTVASPLAGLTMLAALGPFTEAAAADGRVTAVPYLLAALGLGSIVLAARRWLSSSLPRPPLPVVLAGVLFAATLLSVAVSVLSFGATRGVEALQLWVPGIGGGLTVLVAGWLVARERELRPLLVVVAAVWLAALLSAIDYLGDGIVRESAVGWLLRPAPAVARLTGIIPAPNAAAAILLVGVPFAAIGALSGRSTAVRLLSLAIGALLLAAVVLTYSRSALLALVVIAAVMAWHYWRWRGLAIAAAALAAIVAASFVVPGLGIIRSVPAWADEARLAAWSASVGMWAEAPLLGHGMRSFEWLHAQYGSTLDAPHNEWLRFFAEGGAVAGAAALVLLATVVATLVPRQSWMAAAGAGVAASLAVMASFNNPLLYAQVTVPTFIVVGMALGHSPHEPTTGRASTATRERGA